MSDSWDTYDPDSPAAKFPARKVARARKRQVMVTGARSWVVVGSGALGDEYERYDVHLPEGERKYWCSCYSHVGGQYRARSVCTHVIGVLLWRYEHKGVEEQGDTVVESAAEYPHSEDAPSSSAPVEGDESSPSSPSTGPSSVWEEHESPEDPPSNVIPFPGVGGKAVSPTPEKGTEGRAEVVGPSPTPSPQDAIFGTPPLPAKFESFRENQWEAVTEILDHLRNGVRVVMLDAPTGSGKTVIGEAVGRLWGEEIGRRSRLYTCTTKTLQDQIAGDFDYAAVLKGRSNYPTLLTGRPDLTAADCTKERASLPACDRCPSSELGFDGDHFFFADDVSDEDDEWHCYWCHPVSACPYEVAKHRALSGPLAVINIAYLLTEANGPGRFSGRDLVIIDEADTLESELMRHVEVEVSPRMRTELGVGLPRVKSNPEAWVEWIRGELMPAVERKIGSTGGARGAEPDPKQVRARKRFVNFRAKLKMLLTERREEGEDEPYVEVTRGWVYTGYEGYKDESKATVRFRPVKITREVGDGYLWRHAKQWLLMSATPISAEQMADDLGLEDGEWAEVKMDSTFPPERRLVWVDEGVDMRFTNRDRAWPRMAELVEGIISDHPDERILVHTHAYNLTDYLYRHIAGEGRRRLIVYRDSFQREKALEDYLGRRDGVLLAPSFDRGIDLPDDLCRVIVIAKVPYPYKKDKQVEKRLYGTKGGQTWYAVQTIRSLVQMTGRGMRWEGDWCDTYVLDAGFGQLWKKQHRLFPKWWREAVVADRWDPKVAEMMEQRKEWGVGV